MLQPFPQWPKTQNCYISSISCSEPFFQKIWSYRSNPCVTIHPPGDFYSIIIFLTQENAKKWKNAKTQMSNFSIVSWGVTAAPLNFRCPLKPQAPPKKKNCRPPLKFHLSIGKKFSDLLYQLKEGFSSKGRVL